MNILTNEQSKNFKTTIYLTKFRLKHNDTNLKLRLKSNLFLLLAILAIPFILIFITKNNFVFSKTIQKDTNYKSENQIIKGKFKAPINGVITSEYGYRIDPISKKSSKHTGVDIAGSIHCEVKSITDGIVIFSGIQNRIW